MTPNEQDERERLIVTIENDAGLLYPADLADFILADRKARKAGLQKEMEQLTDELFAYLIIHCPKCAATKWADAHCIDCVKLTLEQYKLQEQELTLLRKVDGKKEGCAEEARNWALSKYNELKGGDEKCPTDLTNTNRACNSPEVTNGEDLKEEIVVLKSKLRVVEAQLAIQPDWKQLAENASNSFAIWYLMEDRKVHKAFLDLERDMTAIKLALGK